MDKVLEKTKERVRKAFPQASDQEVDEIAMALCELAKMALDAWQAERQIVQYLNEIKRLRDQYSSLIPA